MFSSNTSQVAAVATQAEAIDFDGTNDYLIRSTDLTGNTDSSTFTFSVWVWSDVSGLSYIYTTDNTTDARVQTWISTTQVGLYMKNSAGTVILNASATVPNNNPPKNTWIHILWSINLASTSNRSCYINDVLQSAVSWDTYTNGSIDFTQPNHNIAGGPALGGYTKARLSNVYLDKTYRDMSVTANRRLFVTADLKPAAGQAALNPILYLPMSDPTQPGKNSGTGGNFTLTGVVARSGRGPNQYNAPYSYLDGSADYLSRTTAPTGIANGKQFTCSFVVRLDDNTDERVFTIATSTSNRFYITCNSNGIQFVGWNSAGTIIFNAESSGINIVAGRNYCVQCAVDLTDTAKRSIYVNGVSCGSFATYDNDNINFNVTSSPVYVIGKNASTTYFIGRLGAFWFNTSYIDLSQPANLAKFVTGTGIDAKPVDLGASGELPTGTSPLIYLPMYGNNAGKNYGTGGDFTVNSGPYTGARGPNEFWGNKADFDGSTGYLSRTSAIAGVSNGKVVSGCIWITMDDISTPRIFQIFTNAGSASSGRRFMIYATSGTLYIEGYNSAGTQILLASKASAFAADVTYCLQFCIDLSNASNRAVYLNGVSQSMTWTTYSNDSMELSAPRVTVGANWTGSIYNIFYDGKLSEFYFTTEYIDFTQEANRLKFRDAFGNPVNLTQQIEAAAIPAPAIYMRFPPTSFGTNSGTGGNFTVTGTITDGGQL